MYLGQISIPGAANKPVPDTSWIRRHGERARQVAGICWCDQRTSRIRSEDAATIGIGRIMRSRLRALPQSSWPAEASVSRDRVSRALYGIGGCANAARNGAI